MCRAEIKNRIKAHYAVEATWGVYCIHMRLVLCPFLIPRKGAKYCDERVCLSLCSLAHVSIREVFSRSACGRGSILLRRRRNILRTSGLADDVMF